MHIPMYPMALQFLWEAQPQVVVDTCQGPPQLVQGDQGLCKAEDLELQSPLTPALHSKVPQSINLPSLLQETCGSLQ